MFDTSVGRMMSIIYVMVLYYELYYVINIIIVYSIFIISTNSHLFQSIDNHDLNMTVIMFNPILAATNSLQVFGAEYKTKMVATAGQRFNAGLYRNMF
jgi:hypothetical protein